MKHWMILLIALIAAGCASSPVEFPDWEVAKREKTPVTDPADLPSLCPIPWTATDCWAAVDEYEIVAEANTEIAQANADALRDTEAGYDSLVEAGKFQQQLAQFREDLLEQERREHFIDNMWHRTLIVLIGVGAIAAN